MSRHVKPTDLTAMVTGRVALAGIIGLVGVAACSSKGLIFSTRKDPLPAEGGAPPKTGNGPGVIHVVPRGDGGECGPFRIDPVQSAPRAPGLLLLVDVSSGMSEPVDMSTWWTTTVSGILDFLAPPKTGFSVGFQFFPAQTVPDACNFAYDAPDIDIGAVDDARGSFINSLVNQSSKGRTRSRLRSAVRSCT